MLDAEVISSLIGMIYDAALDPNGWPGVLERISDLVGGGPAGLIFADPLQGIRSMTTRFAPDAVVDYVATYRALDFMSPALARAPAGTLLLDHDVMSKAAQRRDPFCNEWARPNDIAGGAHAILARDRGGQAQLAITYPRKVDGLSREQESLLRLLLPHLSRAAVAGMRLAVAEADREVAAATLDALADPILLVGDDGRVVRANRAADRLLARTDGLSIGRGGELRAATPAQTRALERLVAEAAGADGRPRTGGTLSLERPSLRSPLRLLAVPLPAGSVWPELPLEPGAILVAVDPDEPRALPSDHLQALFGLTPAEAAVAVALASGEGLPAVADRLGIARATARTHADRILAKTGTGRQAELARLLERLAALA